jgi:hypothetical protein
MLEAHLTNYIGVGVIINNISSAGWTTLKNIRKLPGLFTPRNTTIIYLNIVVYYYRNIK